MAKHTDFFLAPDGEVDRPKSKGPKSKAGDMLLDRVSESSARDPRNKLKATIRTSIAALLTSREHRPEKAEIIEEALDQLSQIMAYVARNGSGEIEALLAGGPEGLAKHLDSSYVAPDSTWDDDGDDFEENRRDKPFDLELFKMVLAGEDTGHTRRTNQAIYGLLAAEELPLNAGKLLENDFEERTKQRNLQDYIDKIWDGAYGFITASTRNVIKSSLDELLASWQNERRFILFIKDRLNNSDDIPQPPSVVERLERLTAYANEYDAESLREFARLLFPEWFTQERSQNAQTHVEVSLPEEAPEIYQGLRGPETPPEFVRRVYGEWLGHGLDKGHIRQLDPTLYQGIMNWSRRNEWPSDVDLPTRAEKGKRWVEKIGASDFSEDALKAARNLLAAKDRQDKRQRN